MTRQILPEIAHWKILKHVVMADLTPSEFEGVR
jgi:hypothetical protein